MSKSLLSTVFLIGLSIVTISCDPKIKTSIKKRDGFFTIKTIIESTSCNCDSLWLKPKTKSFVNALEKATSKDYTIWKGYNIQDGVYVLNAGKNSDSLHCLGLWKAGEILDAICLEDAPSMLTPLYSYYLNYDTPIRRDSLFFDTAKKSPAFSDWMNKHQITSAIYMPTEFPDFPFEIPPETKTQLAIHEAFHTEVMFKYWYAGKGAWPAWDLQPNRKVLLSCYTDNEAVKKLITREQQLLVSMVESLIENKNKEAISFGEQFLTTRSQRYSRLESVAIDLNDGSFGSCSRAEAIMEIEEGLADYGSWSILYQMGFFDKKELIKRYSAKQKGKYYLTGAMLMHLMHLMNGNPESIINKIVNSKSVEKGNLTALFSEKLKAFKIRQQ